MGDKIYLSEEHGLNPALAICPRCGKENGDIILAGNSNKYKCPDCGMVVIASPMDRRRLECPECGFKEGGFKGYWERLGAFDGSREKAAGGLCKECEKAQADCDEAVRAGGVYWKCEKCGSAGALKADHPTAQAARKKLNVEAPAPCGLLVEKCPVCSGEGTEKNG